MSKKAYEYRIVSEECIDDLMEEVNTLLNEGWDLYSSPAITGWHDSHLNVDEVRYIQSLVRRFPYDSEIPRDHVRAIRC